MIRKALRAGLDTDQIEDFLASVDWSGVNGALPEVTEILGELENWTTLYGERQIDKSQFVSKLLRILPAGGVVGFTLSALPEGALLVGMDRYAQPPQTGSGAEPDQGVDESKNDTVQELLARG